MGNRVYLTQEEVAERYRGLVSVGTLANWRVKGDGPNYVKIGRAVLYPSDTLESWEESHLHGKSKRGNRSA